MDMITQIQIKDGVKAYDLLEARIKEVVTTIYETESDHKAGYIDNWVISWFTIPEDISGAVKDRNGRERHVTAEVVYPISATSDLLEKLGYIDFDDFHDQDPPKLKRRFEFPARYLFTDGWEHELEEAANRMALWWAERGLKQAQKILADSKEAVLLREAQLEEATRTLEKLKSGAE